MPGLWLSEKNRKEVLFWGLFAFFYATLSCKNNSMQKQEGQIERQLRVFDTLLRDKAFAQSMAAHLDSSYYAGLGQAAPPFLPASGAGDSARASKKEEKIATNLAGFYALECSVDILSMQTTEPPVAWIERIANGGADSSAGLLLNRFANATWKAGQPFRDPDRITRYNFIGADRLEAEEVKKDAVQIKNAAVKLLRSLQPVKNASLPEQMKALKGLLQDTVYAEEMAAHLDAAYALNQGQKPGPFLAPGDDTATLVKSAGAIKIATNLAGFYALECAVNYLATTKKILPSTLLQGLINKSLSKEDEMLFARFANATWKAGQPFRGLARITRETFTPFYFLSAADIEKDLVQVRAAAEKILPLLKQ